MPASEIKELRKSGQLEEALEMAQNELNLAPDNIWAKRNISWVYYEYLKVNATPETFELFLEYLQNLKDLEMPEDDRMIFDNASYQIGKLIFAIQKMENPDYNKINQVFDIIKNFHFTKPSESYSFLYKAFHKGYKNWSRYLEFADWWNFNNFMDQDYLKDKLPNGKEVMSLVEQAYIAYSKKILEGEESEENEYERIINIEQVNIFLPKLDKIIDDYPDYQYPSYFKAKLLLVLGDKEHVLSSFLSFAKKKRNDFWVWELMSEVFTNDDNRKLACLCKALSLKTPPDFLIKTRQKIASIFIEKKLYSEAKTEIMEIIKTREKHAWRIPFHITQWTQQDWYNSSEQKINNNEFYSKYINTAEEILFQDIPEELVLVEFVNNDKKILNFIRDKNFNGFFKYKGFMDKPIIGDVLKVRLQSKENEKFFKVLTLKRIDIENQQKCEAFKQISGPIVIREGNSFGFLNNVFVSPELIKRNNLNNGDQLKGKAILSFNKKKNEWNWKVFEINLENN